MMSMFFFPFVGLLALGWTTVLALWFVFCILPFVLIYTAWSYYVFRGKVTPDSGYH